MLIVLCISHVDVHLATHLASWIRELGGVKNYNAVLAWDPEVTATQRAPIIEDCQAAFAKVNQIEPRLEPSDRGWPRGPNKMWATIAYVIPQYTNGGPWLFHEADLTPLRSTWADELAEEYRRCGKPFCGILENSWLEPAPGYKMPFGKHLVGVAMYPSNVSQYANLTRDFGSVAFDVALQGELVERGHCAHTNKILHNWLSRNYRREGDVLVCDAAEGTLPGQSGYALTRQVNHVPALVHGCKDLSLINLVRAEHRAKQAPKQRPAVRRIKPVLAQ